MACYLLGPAPYTQQDTDVSAIEAKAGRHGSSARRHSRQNCLLETEAARLPGEKDPQLGGKLA